MRTIFGVFSLGLPKPRSGLEKLAYLCRSDLVRRYRARFSDDPVWSVCSRANRYKKWAVAVAVLGASVLWAGFYDIPVNQFTGLLNLTDFRQDTRPVTRPLSHVVWQKRGQLNNEDPAPALERFGLAYVHSNREGLTGSWLADLKLPGNTPTTNAALWAYIDPTDMFPKVLQFDIERLSPFSASGGEILNQSGIPLRWNGATLTCEVSPAMQNQLTERLEALREAKNVQSRALQVRAEAYQHAVEKWSRRFKLNPDLLYAIIYTESSFNPSLVSNRDAHGLMQVVPRTAGGEVHAWLGEKGTPTSEQLLDPVTNIKYGAAYFHLLLKRHFPKIKDSLSREYCALAAYNAGSGAVYKVFGSNRDAAARAINDMNADEVLEKLMANASRETRGFLKKVISSRTHFLAMN